MTFKTQMTADLSAFYNTGEFAESVTYTALGGAGVTITAIVTRISELLEPYVRGEDNARAEIRVKKANVATPKYGDVFAFNGDSWLFDPTRGVIYEDDNEFVIALERDFVDS